MGLLGKKHTAAFKQARSEQLSARWADPTFRKKMWERMTGPNNPMWGVLGWSRGLTAKTDTRISKRAASLKRSWSNPVVRARRSEIMKEVGSRPTLREKARATMLARWAKPGERQRASNVGKAAWARGRKEKVSLEIRRERMRQAHLGKTPWNKGLHGVMRAWNKGLKMPASFREKIRLAWKKNYAAHAAASTAALLRSRRQKRQTGIERKVETTLLRLFPGEWKYVGLGDVIIGRKVPDFINVNGQKKIVEVYGSYWHKKEDAPRRKKIFRRYGYKTLILWDYDLMNDQQLEKKLIAFAREN